MPNPDSLTGTNPMLLPTIAGVVMIIVSITIFQLMSTHEWLPYIIWLGLPVFAYIISVAVNFSTQLIGCNSVDSQKAFVGAFPTLGTVLLGLGVCYFDTCRIPVATVFSPLFINKTVDIVNKGSAVSITTAQQACCTPKITLESVEKDSPIVKGLSYAFYLFFSMLFGGVIGSSLSSVF